jgi:hypothetical protein
VATGGWRDLWLRRARHEVAVTTSAANPCASPAGGRGDGVGRLPDGRTYSCPEPRPRSGRTARMRLSRSFARASLRRWPASPDRIEPRCPHYGTRGRCQLHLTIDSARREARSSGMRSAAGDWTCRSSRGGAGVRGYRTGSPRRTRRRSAHQLPSSGPARRDLPLRRATSLRRRW